MRPLLLTILAVLAALTPSAAAQSVWLETGLGYRQTASETYETVPRFGVRGTLPLDPTNGLYAAFGVRGGVSVDAGAWFSFLSGAQDPLGLQAHAGAGLALADGSFGLSFSAALTLEVQEGLHAAVTYTHRPLLLPTPRQAFEITAGIRIDLGEPPVPVTSMPLRMVPTEPDEESPAAPLEGTEPEPGTPDIEPEPERP